MHFDEYMKEAEVTAVYPNKGDNWFYPILGLVGETGEIAEKLKKVIRDNNGVIDEDRRNMLKKELGDVLWYMAALCCELGLSFDDVARHNIDKLMDRKKRGMIKGSGDTR